MLNKFQFHHPNLSDIMDYKPISYLIITNILKITCQGKIKKFLFKSVHFLTDLTFKKIYLGVGT